MRAGEYHARLGVQELLQPADLRPVVFSILEQGTRDVEISCMHAKPAIFRLGEDCDRMFAEGFCPPSAAQSSRKLLDVGSSHSKITRIIGSAEQSMSQLDTRRGPHRRSRHVGSGPDPDKCALRAAAARLGGRR